MDRPGTIVGMSEASSAASVVNDARDVLRRWIWVIPLAVVLTTAVALGQASREPKVYRAHGAVVVAADTRAQVLETEMLVLSGAAVRERVEVAMPGAPGVDVGWAGIGDLVELSAEDGSAARAAATVDAYVAAYLDLKREEVLNGLLRDTEQTRRRIVELEVEVSSLTDTYEDAVAEVIDRTALGPGMTPAVAASLLQERSRDIRELDAGVKAQRDALLTQQLSLEDLLRDLEAEHDLTHPGGAQEVGRTPVPTSPIRPKPLRQGIEGAAHGLALGVALSFLFDRLDESIKSRVDADRILGRGVAILASIPVIPEWKDRSVPVVVSLTAPHSPAAEAYRGLRTAVQFASVDRPINALAVASPGAGEGKTTTSANLAVVVASTGRPVVIVDCDLRRPRVHTFFGMSNDVGLTSWMLGAVPLSQAVRPVPGVPGLSLLAAGPIPHNPSELLSSARFAGLISDLKADGALVVVDTAPILVATDVAIASRVLDAVLVVTMLGEGTRKHLVRALEVLARPDAPYVGVVLNGAPSRDRPYRYTIGDPAASRGGGGRRRASRPLPAGDRDRGQLQRAR